jgi:chorismate dehydratase
MWDFEHGNAARDFDITYTLPSGCARVLAEGASDIGIIPAAAYTQIPGLQILPDVAIALTKVLFEKWLGGDRTFSAMEPNLEQMLAQCDAGLLIGDPALQVDRSRYHTLDLAEEWIRYTGKPFVFAFWAVRGEALREADPALDLAAVFRDSRNHGLEPQNLERIVQEWAPRLGLNEHGVREYLTDSIHYQLDAGCLEGLRLFYQYAAEIGALPAAPQFQFAEPTRETAHRG